MSRYLRYVLSALLLVSALASRGFAVTPSLPKNAVAVSAQSVSLPLLSPAPLVSGTIAKGKKGYLLAVEAMMNLFGQAIVADIRPRVNGVLLAPLEATVDCKFTSATSCTDTGTFWIDLDAAELAHPKMFVGKPLVIDLLGENQSASGDPATAGTVTMTAHLLKK